MIPQLDNLLIQTMLLLIDHNILARGLAYTNHSGLFYPASSSIQGTYVYTAPFKQLVNDVSIAGANVISGCYLNGNYVGIGQSGLAGINHYEGAVYFDAPLPAGTVVSGNYAVKEINVKLCDTPEYKLLFETKFLTNKDYQAASLTGIPLDTEITPSVLIRTKSDQNKPFSLGGLETKNKTLRATVITDNEYQRTAICNILKDMNYSLFNIVTGISQFDFRGTLTNSSNPYSFSGLGIDSSYDALILGAKIIDVPRVREFKGILKNTSFCDFELSLIQRHTY